MKLNISPISQRDVRWKDKLLGTSTVSTIGNYGCALTCLTMVCNYFQHETTPAKLNDDLVKVKGFVNGSFLVWGAINQVYNDINIDWNYYIECPDVPAPLEKIDELLNQKIPVLVKVDFSPQAGIQEHWVLIIGKDGDYLINDPWTGETYFFTAKYGDPVKQIYKIVAYKGKVEYEPTCEDKLADANVKIASLNEAVASKSLEVNNLRTELETQERDNQDLLKQLNEARSQRDQFKAEAENWQSKAVSLEKQLESVLSENNSLKSQINDLELTIKEAKQLKLSDIDLGLLFQEILHRLFKKR